MQCKTFLFVHKQSVTNEELFNGGRFTKDVCYAPSTLRQSAGQLLKELEYQYGLLQIEEQIEDECLEFEKLEYLGFWNTLQNEIKM